MREGGDEYSTSGTTKRGAKEEGEKTCVSGETEASRVSLSLRQTRLEGFIRLLMFGN